MSKKTNGVNQLTPSQEEMRMTVVEYELKARYWEAMWKVRYYTLECEKLNPAYEEHTANLRKIQEEAFAKLQEDLKKAKEQAGESLDVPADLLPHKEEVANG